MNKIDEVFRQLDELCIVHNNYTDDELSEKLKNIHHNSPINYTINHKKIADIIVKRVKKYCDKNEIKLEDYKGSLPYRKFIIPVGDMSPKKAKESIKSLMKDYEDMNISLDNLGNVNITQNIDDNKQLKYTYKKDEKI